MDSWTPVPQAFRALTFPLRPRGRSCLGPYGMDGSTNWLLSVRSANRWMAALRRKPRHSHYINGPAGLAHLHRLRALVDAVVVGIGTALADDPQLTVRRVTGPQPARVVIDPGGRLPSGAKLLADDGVRRLGDRAVRGRRCHPHRGGRHRQDRWANRAGGNPCGACRTRHAPRPDRRRRQYGIALPGSEMSGPLHIMVAPIILGSGRPSFSLPPIARDDEALLTPMTVHRLEDEVLFDCDLSAQRVAVGRAKRSCDRHGSKNAPQ